MLESRRRCRHAAGRAVYDYFEQVLADRRANLGDDLISRIITTGRPTVAPCRTTRCSDICFTCSSWPVLDTAHPRSTRSRAYLAHPGDAATARGPP
ncbi:MAG: hypothetical protein IPG46_20175 [Actinobacteria bacterium]|nr:hypothetical protein [Actinomycetota bacterium]